MNSVLCGVAGVLAFSNLASASLVSIDFNTSTPTSPTYSGSGVTAGGLVPLPGQTGAWNVLDLGVSLGGLSTPVSVIDALDGEGNATALDFTLNTTSQIINVYDGPSGSDSLGNDFAFVASNAIVGWTFAGLDAGAEYTIRFFGQVVNTNNTPANFAIISATSGTPATAQANASQNYVTFVVTADAGGAISGTFERESPSSPGSISGVQIALVPEPASVALMGLGTLLMVRSRAGRHG